MTSRHGVADRAAGWSLPALGLLVALLGAAAALTSTGWPGRLPLHLALFIGAGLAWAATLLLLARIAARPSDRRLVLAIAIALRAPAWLAAPAHSDDVYRYVWDGRVTVSGVNPYRFAPAAPELRQLRDGTTPPPPSTERAAARPRRGEGPLWARVNNPDLPTIYPPLAQLFFALAALLPLPPVASLKLLLGLCDLGLLALLDRQLRARGADPRWAIAWGWSPLVAIEIAQNAHLEALPLLLLGLSLSSFATGRTTLHAALLGAATAAKLVTAPALATIRSWRGALAAAVVMVATALPFAGAGGALLGSTGEFARRWRSNDGAYALLQAATDRLVCVALDAPRIEGDGPPCAGAIDLWPRVELAAFISGRAHRAAVYPDELSAFAARAIVALLLAATTLWTLARRLAPLAGAELVLGALVLLTPALHPWYALWLLPLLALTRRRAWLALGALAPLGYTPMASWLAGGAWRDPVWTRLLLHGVVWGLLARDAIFSRERREGIVPPP